jgi:membrane protein YdbS with pleckstrin-like domain
MSNKEIQYKFSPFAVIVGLIVFLIIFAALLTILISLWNDKAYIAVFFLGFLLFIISNEAIPNLFRFSKHLIKSKPALILTEKELIDNVNNVIYPWTEIKK